MKNIWPNFFLTMPIAFLCTGCMGAYYRDPVAQSPDYRIVVAPERPGRENLKAYAPTCASWQAHRPNPFDNQPQPQFGCATSRNLAMQIEKPRDLVQGRELGAPDASRSARSLELYHKDKVKGLYDPNQLPTPETD